MHEEFGAFSPEEEASLDKVWEERRLRDEAAEKAKSETKPKQPDPTSKRPAAVKRPRKTQ